MDDAKQAKNILYAPFNIKRAIGHSLHNYLLLIVSYINTRNMQDNINVQTRLPGSKQ
jgi:hypothetical protein